MNNSIFTSWPNYKFASFCTTHMHCQFNLINNSNLCVLLISDWEILNKKQHHIFQNWTDHQVLNHFSGKDKELSESMIPSGEKLSHGSSSITMVPTSVIMMPFSLQFPSILEGLFFYFTLFVMFGQYISIIKVG